MRDIRNRSSTGPGAGESANAVQPSPGKHTLVEAAYGTAVQRRADGQAPPQGGHVHAAARSSAVQRRAITAGELAGTQADGTDSIFDSKVSTGLKFKIARQLAAPNWNTVIADYHQAIRPIGNAVATFGFIDQKYKFPN